MTHSRLLPMAFLLAACAGGSDAGSDAADAPTDIAAAATRLPDAHRIAIADSVRRTLEAFTVAVQTMNPEDIASFYADDPDMRWIEDGEVRYHAPRDVAAAIREASQTMSNWRLTYDGTEVTGIAPGVALLVTGFAQQFTTLEGETGGFAGAITAVLVHRNGRWLFLHGHTSSLGSRGE